MKRPLVAGLAGIVGVATVGSLVPAPLRADEATPVFATVSCAAAAKPGRIRCRAALELPIEAAAARRIRWAELVVVRADPGVTPLRGRLGPLDAETRDDARWTWSFSVAAADFGERSMDVAVRSAIEPKAGGTSTPIVRTVRVLVAVSP